MSKKVILNPFLGAFGKAIKALMFICIVFHAWQAGSFYSVLVSNFLKSKGLDIGSSFVLQICMMIIAAVITIFGAKIPASFLFFEWHVKRTNRGLTGNPECNPVYKTAAIVALLFVVFLEGFMAVKGSQITAQTFVPETTTLTASITTLEKTKADALAPFNAKVLDLEAKIDEEVKASTSGELKKLIGKGNSWAKSEQAAIRKEIEAKYKKDLKAAKDAYNAEVARWSTALATATKTDGKKIEQDLQRATVIEESATSILRFLGIVTILVMFFCQYAVSANKASELLGALTKEEVLKYEEAKAKRATNWLGFLPERQPRQARSHEVKHTF